MWWFVGKYTIISLISLSKPFGTPSQKPTENAAARTNLSLTGTARYASINAHRGAFHPGGGDPRVHIHRRCHTPENWEDCGPGKFGGNFAVFWGTDSILWYRNSSPAETFFPAIWVRRFLGLDLFTSTWNHSKSIRKWMAIVHPMSWRLGWDSILTCWKFGRVCCPVPGINLPGCIWSP